MISATIVIASVGLAVAYILAWLISPRFRQQIEQPKYWFQQQIGKYDDKDSHAD